MYPVNPYALEPKEPAILNDSNTVLWFKFCDIANITKDGNDKVASVLDSSGNSRTLTQATDTKKPIWSVDGLLFDGIDDFMNCAPFTLAQPYIVYIVFKKVSTTGSRVMSGNGNVGLLYYQTISQVTQFSGTNGSLASVPVGQTKVITALFNGSSSFISSDDDRLQGNPGSAAAGGFYIGTNGWLQDPSNILVKEVIIRKIDDTTANYNVIRYYLRNKYNL